MAGGRGRTRARGAGLAVAQTAAERTQRAARLLDAVVTEERWQAAVDGLLKAAEGGSVPAFKELAAWVTGRVQAEVAPEPERYGHVEIVLPARNPE